ncbi:MAG: hypothetical protein KDD36_03100 [Flavobacteriales bacterium]|nr:hypothetical protein [Flavobacteriales bacterium]
MKRLVTIFILCLTLGIASAQDYSTGIGLRFGFFNGITVKHFVQPSRSLEGIITTRWKGYQLTGLYQWHFDTGMSNLYWFLGAGVHTGFYNNGGYYYDRHGKYYNKTVTPVGVDGVAGLEFVFPSVPITLTFDARPFIELVYPGPEAIDVAFSARFYLE